MWNKNKNTKFLCHPFFRDKKVIVSKNISGVWYQHNANISKTLNPKKNLNNLGLYIKLYMLSLKKNYNKWKCLKWLIKAIYIYVRSYFYKLIRKEK